MSLTDGVAYGESFDTALAAVRFEGEGVRLDNIQLTKSGGRGTGAAFVGWTTAATRSTSTRRDIPIESAERSRSNDWFPLSGLLDFSAGGSGTFDDAALRRQAARCGTSSPATKASARWAARSASSTNLMTLKLEAASSRLAVSGAGRIELTPGRDADISFRVTDTSLDPYVRALEPRLSPFTTAVASGTHPRRRPAGRHRSAGRSTPPSTALDMRLFDYRLRNAAPLRVRARAATSSGWPTCGWRARTRRSR